MTSEQGDHIIRSYDEELEHLKELIARMGGLAETQLADAVDSLVRNDQELATRTIRNDEKIDEIEHELDTYTVRMLALRQPVASDLRMVISALKVASDLERIGDYAANVAKRVVALHQQQPLDPVRSLPRMAKLVQGNIKRVLDAYAKRDANMALNVWESDQEIDEMYTSLFRETLTYMMEDPRSITAGTHLLFIAKNIERIGDHATNIAEIVYFMATGNQLMIDRPKGDTSSFAVVEPPEEGKGAHKESNNGDEQE